MKNKNSFIAMIAFLFFSHAISWMLSYLGHDVRSLVWWVLEFTAWISYILGCLSGGIDLEITDSKGAKNNLEV